MFNDWQSWLAFGVAILIAYGVVLWLGITVWTYRDIRQRTHDQASQFMAVLLVLIFNIPGLFLYLVLRPHETLTESYERRLEAEAIKQELAEARRACPTCGRATREEFLLCPFCRTNLQQPCSRCSKPLDYSWTACPYCGAAAPEAAARALSRQPAPAFTPPDQPGNEPARPAPTPMPTRRAEAAERRASAPQASTQTTNPTPPAP